MPSDKLIEQMGTGLERYQLEGGAWLSRAPVIVNEDFDFATAMAMSGVGAGLAAGKRKQSNERKAAALAQAEFAETTHARLNALRACGTHAFFVLWGNDTLVLRLILDTGVRGEDHAVESKTRGAYGMSLEGWKVPGVLDAAANMLLGSHHRRLAQ